MKKAFFILFMMVIIAGCAGRPTPIPDADTPEARLYAEKCSTCHSLAHPMRQSSDEWVHLVELMEVHMDRIGMPPLTGDEREVIMEYLKGHSR